MIQRIQTVYLILAALALGLQFLLPYAIAPADSAATNNAIFTDGVFNPLDNIGLMGLTGLGIIDTILAIFLFKNRPVQGSLSIMAVVVSIMLIALIGVTFYNLLNQLAVGTPLSYHLGLALPPLAVLFQWLAQRSIKKDERLVKSMDRLR